MPIFQKSRDKFLPQIPGQVWAHNFVSSFVTNPDLTWSKATKNDPEILYVSGETFNPKQIQMNLSGFDP